MVEHDYMDYAMRCIACSYHMRGESSRIDYCLASDRVEYAHQMRQVSAPCGPDARLYKPIRVMPV